ASVRVGRARYAGAALFMTFVLGVVIIQAPQSADAGVTTWPGHIEVSSVSVGAAHTCAVAGGQAFCWGSGANGRLGTGDSSDQLTPVAVDTTGVLAGKTVTAI